MARFEEPAIRSLANRLGCSYEKALKLYERLSRESEDAIDTIFCTTTSFMNWIHRYFDFDPSFVKMVNSVCYAIWEYLKGLF